MLICSTTLKSWRPPHCPNPNCYYHKHLPNRWRYKKAGFFLRVAKPHRIQRFTCLHCRRSFSSQTFSTTYWQRKPQLEARLFMKTLACSANRQVARALDISPATVDRRLSRLGRHCMLFHANLMQSAPPASDIVVDGFESFELSQYHPFHHNVAVEKGTDFFLYFNDSELRRKGRMTPYQKRRREQLEKQHGRPDPKAIEKDMRDLLETVLGSTGKARIYSDDHPQYRRPIRELGARVEHLVTPGKDRRNRHNPLWEVNLLDLLIRHSSSNHKRETIAWSKRRQCSAERMGIFQVWRNYMKGRREKVRGSPTPAMERGMSDHRLSVQEILGQRLFRSRIDLPARWAEYYDSLVETRGLRAGKRRKTVYV